MNKPLLFYCFTTLYHTSLASCPSKVCLLARSCLLAISNICSLLVYFLLCLLVYFVFVFLPFFLVSLFPFCSYTLAVLLAFCLFISFLFVKVSKLEAHILRLEHKLDDKDQVLYHAKLETRNKARYLKQTIQDLRRQFSGSLPLLKQQKFAEAMRNLHESKTKLQLDLEKVTCHY